MLDGYRGLQKTFCAQINPCRGLARHHMIRAATYVRHDHLLRISGVIECASAAFNVERGSQRSQ